MTFEELAKANAGLKTTDVKGKDYVEVNQRIKAFRMCFPEGSIQTEIVSLENGVVTMKATVSNDGKVLGTGTAQEKEGSTYINKTSYIENCETSAVGRALGMCGFGIDTSIASLEEVTNAINNQNEQSKEKVYCCENCGEVFRPMEARGKKYTAEEIYENSKKANGQALCKSCADAWKERQKMMDELPFAKMRDFTNESDNLPDFLK